MLKVAISTLIKSEKDKLKLEGKVEYYNKYLSQEGLECFYFDWKDLKSNGTLKKLYQINNTEYNVTLAHKVDVILTRQLGDIAGCEDIFLQYLKTLKNIKGPILVNCPDKMLNNLDKIYLIDLEKKGFDVIPSIIVDSKTSFELLEDFKKKINANDLIIKPRFFGECGNMVELISNLNQQTFQEYTTRLDKAKTEYFKHENSGSAIVQPFLKKITEGEVSLLPGRSLFTRT